MAGPGSRWDAREWIISVLLLIALGAVGWSWGSVTGDVAAMQKALVVHDKESAADRTKVESLQSAVDRIDSRTQKMYEFLMQKR
jgi:hypothetical protein